MIEVFLMALLPVVAIGSYVYIRDAYEREPIVSVLKAFFLGCLSVVPVLFFGSIILPFTPQDPFWEPAFTAFITASFLEEANKLIMLLLFVRFSKEFNERMDGIVYAVFISLGFAAVENILYVSSGGLQTAMLRSVTAVPAHAVFGVLMGFHFSKAYFNKENKLWHYLVCFLFPFFWHGAYDYILMIAPYLEHHLGFSALVALIGFIIFLVYTYKMGIKRINIFRVFSRNRWGRK